MFWTCYDKHLHDFYHDISDLNCSDSWYFHMDSTFVTHIVSHNVSDKSRWIPLLLTWISNHKTSQGNCFIYKNRQVHQECKEYKGYKEYEECNGYEYSRKYIIHLIHEILEYGIFKLLIWIMSALKN